jgi:23S rRNA (adenine2503-C2)-methyltransferase
MPPEAGQLTFAAPRRAKPPRHLADLEPAERRAAVADLGEPPFRADQLSRHYFTRHTADPGEMTDLPERIRTSLASELLPTLITPVRHVECDGGATRKTLWRLFDGALVESVLMRYGSSRTTLCVSSQAGCGMNCPFCATGQAGLTRNMSAAEIIEQVVAAARMLRRGEIAGGPGRVTNVVFMGMGEPLANYGAVIRAVRRMIDPAPSGLGLGQRGVTVSTVGLVPAIDKLAAEGLQVTLALSLHAPDDELRDELVPINTRWKVAEAIDAARRLRGDRPAGVDRVRAHPWHQRPGMAGGFARPATDRTRSRLGSRQSDPAQPDTGLEVDGFSAGRRACLRHHAPGAWYPGDGEGHPGARH